MLTSLFCARQPLSRATPPLKLPPKTKKLLFVGWSAFALRKRHDAPHHSKFRPNFPIQHRPAHPSRDFSDSYRALPLWVNPIVARVDPSHSTAHRPLRAGPAPSCPTRAQKLGQRFRCVVTIRPHSVLSNKEQKNVYVVE